ncbi:Metallophosphoesterase domain protein [Moelleriella libera RCEF 2490]|uniref:Metallophosphoesterase domain protein n=1 Tax=Moelleriella libera RCEF 2490 TaxID=1081109 RepID=A0A166UQS5_9HYPO|nr:Metallophosphoesterase domain protein [Moelleriella libera RCEF 2490]
MAVQILSDLHLGFPKTYAACVVPPKAPYLALLGNIGNVVPHKNEFLTFLTTHLRLFKAVLFVPGNHEAYHSNWEDTLAALRVFEEQVERDDSLGHFQVLDRGTYRPPGSDTVILGCSLFSHVPQESQMAVEMGIIDFYLIEDWSVAKHNKAHQRDVAWLNDEVAKLEECRDATSIIILTHWSPSRLSGATDPKHIGSPIISGSSTDLTNERCFGSVKVKMWAFGHTNYNCDIETEREGGAGTLRLVANQRGYFGSQLDGFDVEKTILL